MVIHVGAVLKLQADRAKGDCGSLLFNPNQFKFCFKALLPLICVLCFTFLFTNCFYFALVYGNYVISRCAGHNTIALCRYLSITHQNRRYCCVSSCNSVLTMTDRYMSSVGQIFKFNTNHFHLSKYDLIIVRSKASRIRTPTCGQIRRRLYAHPVCENCEHG